MAIYQPDKLLADHSPGPWSPAVDIHYDRRDVLLYAVGIGCTDLAQVYEGHARFAVFPTFPIRWCGAGFKPDAQWLPPSPGPMMLDAERWIECLAPLPVQGTVQVRSRLLAAHPRSKGAAFVEVESEVHDADGRLCVRQVVGSYRRGVAALGDIEPFEGRGQTRSVKLPPPARPPELRLHLPIAANQALLYRLSGDYNPLHIDPEAAKTGGFDAPILHGLCTLGHCAQALLDALAEGEAARFRSLGLRFASPVLPGDRLDLLVWQQAPGQVLFEARVGERVVVSNGRFGYAAASRP